MLIPLSVYNIGRKSGLAGLNFQIVLSSGYPSSLFTIFGESKFIFGSAMPATGEIDSTVSNIAAPNGMRNNADGGQLPQYLFQTGNYVNLPNGSYYFGVNQSGHILYGAFAYTTSTISVYLPKSHACLDGAPWTNIGDSIQETATDTTLSLLNKFTLTAPDGTVTSQLGDSASVSIIGRSKPHTLTWNNGAFSLDGGPAQTGTTAKVTL